MKKQNEVHQQSIFDSTGLLPAKSWKTAIVHIAILIVVVFLTEISNTRADMVFDFQMKLAQKGNAEAQLMVGEMYEAGRGVEKDTEQAMAWINKAAEQGNKAAGYKLLYYDLDKNSLIQGNKAQLDELTNAASAGDGHAQYYIGLMHSRGVGMRQDSTQAVNWLSKASLQGITAAEDEIMRINEAKQSKASSNRIKKPVKTKPAAKMQVTPTQQQPKKTPKQNEKKSTEKAAASGGKSETKTGLVQR
jgi:TPR repeat protein